MSQNWGSHAHIITHSNANVGCHNSINHFLTIYEHANDHTLAENLEARLNPAVPGSASQRHETVWAELEANRQYGDTYVELQFHTNSSTQAWLHGGSHQAAYNYGVAVDITIGYP